MLHPKTGSDWKNSFTNLPLKSLPWILERHTPLEISSYPLIKPTIQCFCRICKHTSLSTIPGLMTPIRLNPDFLPGMTDDFLAQHWSDERVLAQNFYDHGKPRTASHLSTLIDKPPIPPWTYLLITHYLRALDRNSSCSRQLTPFERLCTQDPSKITWSPPHIPFSLCIATPQFYSMWSMGKGSVFIPNARRVGKNSP